jgi:hypothetical protein
MDNVELLLSDEFVEFSKHIGEIHAKKKAKTEEFRAIHAEFKNVIAQLDNEAKEASAAWEEWKTTKAHK